MLTRKEEKADLTLVANPNNPTGESINKKRLKQFIKNNTNRLVVVDEVLLENIKDSVVEFVNAYKNLVIVKSFSKLFRIPGLRIGYIITNPFLIKMIDKTVSPYEVSSLSLYIAKKIMLDYKYIDKTKKQLEDARNLLKRELPLLFSKTNASVGLIDGGRGSALYDYLLRHDILTVDGKNFRGLEKTNTVRIVINSIVDIKKLIPVIEKYGRTYE